MASSNAPVPGPSPSTPDDGEGLGAEVEVADRELLLLLTGPGAERLSIIERACDVQAGLRGDVIHLQGAPDKVALAQRVLRELIDVLRDGTTLPDQDIASSVRLLRDHPQARLSDLFQHVVVTAAGGRQITPRGLAQKYYVQAIQGYDVVFGVGPAGTGKTYLAMAMAVAALQSQRMKRIILTRPAVEAGEKLGFLPGDLAEKVNPYLRPLYDALYDVIGFEKVGKLLERQIIEVAPLAFMRGRTLNDSFIILDEAQNTTPEQMKMFLTRIGYNSKAVINGDVTQVDLPTGRASGLVEAQEVLAGIAGISFFRFTKADVVRHPLVQKIVNAYENFEERRARPAEVATAGGVESGT
jgi:phosphate starvation-inducible PhoH-like protein